MANTAARMTVTGKIGPGDTLTASVFTGVTFYSLNCLTNVLHIECDQGRFDIDVSAATTWTTTISGATQTITIS